MKHIVSKVRFRAVLPLLFTAVLLTLPSAATGSKYVWEDTIDLTLKVSYPEQSITSIGPVGYLSESWIRDLTNIQAVPTAEGLILTAEAGYRLPACIIVEIGQAAFSVKTDGSDAIKGITFDPETGLLSIEKNFVLQNMDIDNPGNVTIKGVAVEEAAPDQGTSAEEGTPAEEGTFTEEGTTPAEEETFTGEGTPAEEGTFTEEGTPPAEEGTFTEEGTPSVEEENFTGEGNHAEKEASSGEIIVSELDSSI